jgi:peptidoglycan biosynthesis protein MviN/MurJ (putative lipid II flippase)
MAIGTLISRVTGFLRTFVFVFALGTATLANGYNLANTLPNAVYDVMIGGVLTSVVVPLLVKAAKEHRDSGEAYDQRIFTLSILGLGAVTVVATVAAGLLGARRRAPPDGRLRVLLHPADLLLRPQLPDRRDPEYQEQLRRADVDADH